LSGPPKSNRNELRSFASLFGGVRMFPLITCMEELMIYMGRMDLLPPHFGDEAGRSGFSSETLLGNPDGESVTGTRDGYVE
jgi:hypothetical protein